MDHASFKKTLISQLALAPYFEAAKDTELTLVTTLGFIRGRLTLLHEVQQKNEPPTEGSRYIGEQTEFKKSMIATLVDATAESYCKEYNLPENSVLPGNDGALALHDVTISDFAGNAIPINELIVFYDQIIAITFASRNQQ